MAACCSASLRARKGYSEVVGVPANTAGKTVSSSWAIRRPPGQVLPGSLVHGPGAPTMTCQPNPPAASDTDDERRLDRDVAALEVGPVGGGRGEGAGGVHDDLGLGETVGAAGLHQWRPDRPGVAGHGHPPQRRRAPSGPRSRRRCAVIGTSRWRRPGWHARLTGAPEPARRPRRDLGPPPRRPLCLGCLGHSGLRRLSVLRTRRTGFLHRGRLRDPVGSSGRWWQRR